MASDKKLTEGRYVYPKHGYSGTTTYDYTVYPTRSSDIPEWEENPKTADGTPYKYSGGARVQYKGNVYDASKFIYLLSSDGQNPIDAVTTVNGRTLRVWMPKCSVSYLLKMTQYSFNQKIWLPDGTEQLDKYDDPIYGTYPDGSKVTVGGTLSPIDTLYGDLTELKEKNFSGRLASGEYGFSVRVLCLYTPEGLDFNYINPNGGDENKPYEKNGSLYQRYYATTPYRADDLYDYVGDLSNGQKRPNPKYDLQRLTSEDDDGNEIVNMPDTNGISGISQDTFYNWKTGQSQYDDWYTGEKEMFKEMPEQEKIYFMLWVM